MFDSSVWALDDALVAQLFWHVEFPAHASMHEMIPEHAGSLTHDWVTEQQLDMTQLAHDAALKVTPQAAVPPLDPLELPLPLPDELFWALHALAQLTWAHCSRVDPDCWHWLDAEQFEVLAPDGHTHDSTLEEQSEFAALTWLLQLACRQLEQADDGLIPTLGQLVAE